MSARAREAPTLYKWLNGREATHAPEFRYRLKVWTPPVKGELVPCVNGYHLVREKDLPRWIARDLFVAEHDGELVEDTDKVVVRRCRIVEHLAGWNERTSRLFAADCAERVLPLFEAVYPDDDRPRLAIQATRDYANGLIDAAAWAAAWDAARAAARDAAWDAAGAAEREWQAARILDYAHGRDAARAALGDET